MSNLKNVILSDEMEKLIIEFCKSEGIAPSKVIQKAFALLKILHEKPEGYHMALVKHTGMNVEDFKIIK